MISSLQFKEVISLIWSLHLAMPHDALDGDDIMKIKNNTIIGGDPDMIS